MTKKFENYAVVALVALSLTMLALFVSDSNAYKARMKSADPVFETGGANSEPFRVCGSSTAVSQVLAARVRRSALLQNSHDSASRVDISTFSTFTSSSNKIVELLPGQAYTTHGDYPLFMRVAPNGTAACVNGE
jgi:hypothetical protein